MIHETDTLIVRHIADIEASIIAIRRIDMNILQAMAETATQWAHKDDWQHEFEGDWGDFWCGPVHWQIEEEGQMTCSALFELDVAEDNSYSFDNENSSCSLIARLCQVEGSAGTVGVWWYMPNSGINKKQWRVFTSKHSQAIAAKTGFIYVPKAGNFFLPLTLNHAELISAIENGDISESLEPFQQVLVKIKAAEPVFTNLLKEAEIEFKVKLVA